MPIDEPKNEWKNDLISFISHECYNGNFKVLQADIYRNTRKFQASRPSKEEPNRFEKNNQSQFIFRTRAAVRTLSRL